MNTRAAPSPPSGECIGLAWASLVIFSLLLPAALFMAYKHGKPGNMCWPLLVVSTIFQIIWHSYYLTRQNEPDVPTTVTMMTSSASTGTMSLLVIGLIYEALNLSLSPSKRVSNKGILAAMHVIYMIGTVMAAYGGSRDSETPEVPRNDALNKVGNVLMFLVMLSTAVWLWPAAQQVFLERQDVNYHAANALIMAAAPSTVFQSIRLSYDLNYAFTNISTLSPATGSFAIRFISFSIQLAIVMMALTAGWFSRNASKVRLAAMELYSTSSHTSGPPGVGYHDDSSRRALIGN